VASAICQTTEPTSSDFRQIGIYFAELGTSLFEIAQSLFALEQTLILGAMALNKKNSEE